MTAEIENMSAKFEKLWLLKYNFLFEGSKIMMAYMGNICTTWMYNIKLVYLI